MLQEIFKISSTTMTMLDVTTDIIVSVQWYRDNHTYWFAFGLSIILLSDIAEGLLFSVKKGLTSGFWHFLGFGTIYECLRWWGNRANDDDYMAAKVFEASFEAGPFLVLQSYVAMIEEDYAVLSIISIGFSVSSVGYIAAFINKRTKLKSEIKNVGSFLILISVCVVDVILRTASIVLLLRSLQSVSLRVCAAAVYLVSYLSLVFLTYDDFKRKEIFILYIVCYSVMNIMYFELETICRGLVTAAILIFLYLTDVVNDVVNDVVLAVSVALTMCYVIVSFWRLCVKDDFKNVRMRAFHLSCCCCIPFCCSHRVKEQTLEDAKASVIEF